MTEPYYADPSVQLHHGDCLDVLRALPDASVDAVVTDPPYLLGFMGRAWDTKAAHEHLDWHRAWCDEAFRVLRPGGHLLAFGGTRTSHRLACAIEDAGFEIRDSIAWLFGSGFPKSLDVSKAIDRDNGRKFEDRYALGREIRAARIAAGLSVAEVNTWFGYASGCQHWESQNKEGARVPTLADFTVLQDRLGLSDTHRHLVERVEAERGVVGTGTSGATAGLQLLGPSGIKGGDYDLTAPATPDAQHWKGWGTALKPAWENVIQAQKPDDTWGRIGSHLDALGESCRQPVNGAAQSSPPTPAGSSEARIATAPERAATRHEGEPASATATGAAGASSAVTATSASESVTETCWNIVTSWKRCWVALCEPTSTSTTETTSSTTTDPTTLWSCLSQLTHPNTILDPTSPDGLSSLAQVVDNLFAAAVLNSNATRALTATETATSPTPPPSPAGAALSQIVVARKPLAAGTVAANVLAFGTGALNVDACRIESSGERYNTAHGSSGFASGYELGTGRGTPAAGRWPPNVAMDESQAAVLDAMSGELPSQQTRTDSAAPSRDTDSHLGKLQARGRSHEYLGDTGGASRFMYVAKAGADERVRLPKDDGDADMFAGNIRKRCTKCGKQEVNMPGSACQCTEPDYQPDPSMSGHVAHPTVKPLALMRWLVRLVTPPGGTCLEPFAGSGTTVEACILEGFACIAIEREADYLPLIVQRVNRRRNPVEAVRQAGADMGLFDLLDDLDPNTGENP